MKFKLEIELGNDTMRRYRDLRWMARELAKHLESYSGTPQQGTGHSIRDINGNAVGKWEIVQEGAK